MPNTFAYRVAAASEQHRPLKGVTIEAISVDSTPTISATARTANDGTATFTALTGPHWFRVRARRTSGSVGERGFTGIVEVQVINITET